MSDLRACYERLSNLIQPEVEPFDTIETVEKYRKYWRPADVRVILLAESHVFTSGSDLECHVREYDDLPNYPTKYVNFVYCLAYGEKELIKGSRPPSKNVGTWQYWKLFYSCLNEIESNACFHPVIKRCTSDLQIRITNKIKLLNSLKDNGIWLVDASIMGLYGRIPKLSPTVKGRIIQASWLDYTRDVVQKANPDHVIVIGKGVANIVERDIEKFMGQNNYSVIEQPQAHLPKEELLNNFKKYYQICSEQRSRD